MVRKHCSQWLAGLLGLVCIMALAAQADPPFHGTVHDIDPDIVTSADPSSLLVVEYAGRGVRTVFDRRPNTWVEINAYLFDVRFDDGSESEVQVNPEFGSVSNAREQADLYAHAIGQLPVGLRTEVLTVWIHKGGPNDLLGGGNNNILIHTGEAENLSRRGTLEEALLHEAAHSSLDPFYHDAPRWLEAQQADGSFISAYARDHPDREDIAESVVPWIAVRYRRDRIHASVADTIVETMPNRMAFFDSLDLDMRPLRGEHTLSLFMSAVNPTQQGFMRIINHSDRGGTVRIDATDDAGHQAGPISLNMEARASVQLNSSDLESGNPSKGLPNGIGTGTGNWRLRLDSGLNIEALAYVRAKDGFVTSVHDLVVGFGKRHHVAIFNPASNHRQQSVLRLINDRHRKGQVPESRTDGDEGAVAVEILAYDDSGDRAPMGVVRLNLMPGEARMITAQELEWGGDRLDGLFGDGQGKWHLYVSADKAIRVMNLLRTPEGHLTNLSTSTSVVDFAVPPAQDAM